MIPITIVTGAFVNQLTSLGGTTLYGIVSYHGLTKPKDFPWRNRIRTSDQSSTAVYKIYRYIQVCMDVYMYSYLSIIYIYTYLFICVFMSGLV